MWLEPESTSSHQPCSRMLGAVWDRETNPGSPEQTAWQVPPLSPYPQAMGSVTLPGQAQNPAWQPGPSETGASYQLGLSPTPHHLEMQRARLTGLYQFGRMQGAQASVHAVIHLHNGGLGPSCQIPPSLCRYMPCLSGLSPGEPLLA